MTNRPHTLSRFIDEFVGITRLTPSIDHAYRAKADELVSYMSRGRVLPLPTRRASFLSHINRKFRLNAQPILRFYTHAAMRGFTFNHHAKSQIAHAFNSNDPHAFVQALSKHGIPKDLNPQLLELFTPVTTDYTLTHIANECESPSKLRKDHGGRDIRREITRSLFSAFLWESLSPLEMHRFFDPHFIEADYNESFWDQLHKRQPHLFSRDNALHVLRVTTSTIHANQLDHLRASISNAIEGLYKSVDNYGFLAIVIDSARLGHLAVEWTLASDAILFAEKHRETPISNAFFRWTRIQRETVSHIPTIDPDAARFDYANEGFTYRDSFVLTVDTKVSRLLIILQKNARDETLIPCPTCRSTEVRGNSYPAIGVRSWECMNVLCPDRSKYNRGKRYSFRGILMQHAINDPRNMISAASVQRWIRDVLTDPGDEDVIETLVRHYSMYGDTVHLHNWPSIGRDRAGRRIQHHRLSVREHSHAFWNGPFFRRYLVKTTYRPTARSPNLGTDDFGVFVGDASDTLRTFGRDAFDGAVTSPPYYNAREYSHWPNVYCYLNKMYDVNLQVYRTLTPGALYLYNIFDYFDNECTMAFSAMGKKRIMLSAYTAHMFRMIGFDLLGVIVWDKGDIEGKRGYNAGNFSPYYQSPFNCWEHVLVFRKPDQAGRKDGTTAALPPNRLEAASQVLRAQPVIKMIRGSNVHGHSAPFPDALPELLISRMRPNSVVLDPFAGSLTTGRVAQRFGVRSVCIDTSAEYCRLGIELWRQERADEALRGSQMELF